MNHRLIDLGPVFVAPPRRGAPAPCLDFGLTFPKGNLTFEMGGAPWLRPRAERFGGERVNVDPRWIVGMRVYRVGWLWWAVSWTWWWKRRNEP